MVNLDGPERVNIQLTDISSKSSKQEDEVVETFNVNTSFGGHVPAASTKKPLRHKMTMGGHDNIPLGFKIADVRKELLRVHDGTEKERQELVKFIDAMDEDGDGTITVNFSV